MKSNIHSMGWFVLVGIGATLVHFLPVMACARWGGLAAACASMIGWMLAVLALVLVGIAVATCLTGRHWAFASP